MPLKKITRVLALCLLLLILCGSIPPLPVSAAGGQQSSAYKKKVISVVYDNSGSMNAGANKNAILYARYSLQILLSTLNQGDELVVFPMNNVKNILDKSPTPIEFTMGSGSCTAAIENVIDKDDIKTANGSTPFGTVTRAVEELCKRGMKTVSEAGDVEQDTEYWLVVMTDGDFGEIGTDADKLQQELRGKITPYSGLHTVYLALGKSAVDLTGSDLTRSAPFTALRAADKSNLIAGMQRVGNLISGKYTLPEDYFEVSGNTVTLDLERAAFSFRTISALLQDCPATLQSVTCNGSNITPIQSAALQGDPVIGIDAGCFAAMEGNPYFSSGKLQLTFSEAIPKEKISFTGEPALSIRTYFEVMGANGWERKDINYVNSNLTKNDRIRAGYEVFEQANGKQVDMASVFGGVEAKVSYAGKGYLIGEEIPLLVGKNEIGISVSVMNGVYTLNTSVMCVISENPTYYRIETQKKEIFDLNTNKVQVLFDVYDENKKLSLAELAAYQCELWGKRQDGSDLPITVTKEANGTITAQADLQGLPAGELCSVSMRVISPDNITREATVETKVRIHILALQLEKEGPESLSLTQYEMLHNTQAFHFTLTANNSIPLRFDDEGVNLRVTLGGRDIAGQMRQDANKLTFVPDGESLGADFTSPGQKELVVTVSAKENANVSAEARICFEVKPSVFALIPSSENKEFSVTTHQLISNRIGFCVVPTMDGHPISPEELTFGGSVGAFDITPFIRADGEGIRFVPTTETVGTERGVGDKKFSLHVGVKELPFLTATYESSFSVRECKWEIRLLPGAVTAVDRFAIEQSGAEFRMMVLRDDIPLEKEELEELLKGKEVAFSSATFDKNFLLPVGKETEVVEENGAGVIVYRVVRDQFLPIAGVTSMLIFNGDKTVHISCNGAEVEMIFSFAPSEVWSYIWRLLIILLIIYIIIYFVCGFRCKTFSPGRLVSITISDYRVQTSVKPINCTFRERYLWHLLRWLPWNLTMNQPDHKGLTFKADREDKKRSGKKTTGKDAVARFKMKSRPGATIMRASMRRELPQMTEFLRQLRKKTSAKLDLTPEQARGMFTLREEIGTYPKLDSSYFATVNKSGKIVKIQFYIFGRKK